MEWQTCGSLDLYAVAADSLIATALHPPTIIPVTKPLATASNRMCLTTRHSSSEVVDETAAQAHDN